MSEATRKNSAPPLSQLWQLPVLAAGVLLFGLGLYVARPSDPEPQYGVRLDEAAELIEAGRYERAGGGLKKLEAGIEEQGEPVRRRYHLLVGDATYLASRPGDGSDSADPGGVIAAYRSAQGLGADLGIDRVLRLAQSYVARDEVEAALGLLDEAGEAGSAARQRLLKRVIRASLGRYSPAPEDEPKAEAIAGMIDRLLAEEGLTPAYEAWAAARRAELNLRRGRTGGVVERLLRRIARLREKEGAPLGELMLRLGQAYLAEGEPGRAKGWFRQAREAMEEADPLRGEVLVGLGRVRLNEGNAIGALEPFTRAVERYAHTPSYAPALVGKAESEVRRGAWREGLADYTRAVKLPEVGPASDRGVRSQLIGSLENQHDVRFAQGDYKRALKFLDLEGKLFEPLPARLHLKRAITQEHLARKRLGLKEGERAEPAAWERLEAAERKATAVAYAASADAYFAHARAVAEEDAEAYARSLWRAGDHYERAGLHERAIEVSREFIDQRPGDPRALAAKRRLAQAHRARGDFERAIELYRGLIEEHPKSPEAYESLVPLARSYLAMGPDFRDRAEQVLRSVVSDHPALRPESAEYRTALIELGRLYYRRGGEGDYERAIVRLEETLRRYPDGENAADLRFLAGDARRKSAAQIEQALERAMPEARRKRLSAERTERLERAEARFAEAIEAYERSDEAGDALGELQKLYLRNAYFYRADCQYELGRFEGTGGAIDLYERARRAYGSGPAALAALVQIVNVYAELGRWEDVRRANERARVYLRRFSDEALDDPTLPMGREHWQRWLEATSGLAAGESTASARSP